MAYNIEPTEDAEAELDAIKRHDRKEIIDEVDKHLKHQPTVATRNRKCLTAVEPEFEYNPPLRELRVGDYRVFYDVDEESEIVHVRAIRRKSPTQRTKDIIQ
jgi:mRNA-degrading endonuclease RelE of RelBE toxin-antitoxin system